MGTRDILAGVLLCVMGAGGAAMTQVGTIVFPHHENLIFWIGFAAVVVGFVGLVALVVLRPKGAQADAQRPPPTTPGSTTAKASGLARIELVDVTSTANTLADAQDDSSIIARVVRHDPPEPA